MYLGSVKSVEDDRQDITRYKAGKQKLLGEGLCIFKHSQQEFLHGSVFQIIG
jgi:hypothetical protein